jgi:hypothetical protein
MSILHEVKNEKLHNILQLQIYYLCKSWGFNCSDYEVCHLTRCYKMANIPSSLFLSTLMMKVICSSKTLVLTRAQGNTSQKMAFFKLFFLTGPDTFFYVYLLIQPNDTILQTAIIILFFKLCDINILHSLWHAPL